MSVPSGAIQICAGFPWYWSLRMADRYAVSMPLNRTLSAAACGLATSVMGSRPASAPAPSQRTPFHVMPWPALVNRRNPLGNSISTKTHTFACSAVITPSAEAVIARAIRRPRAA